MSYFKNTHFSTTVEFHEGELPITYEDLGIPHGAKFGIIKQNVVECEMDQTQTVLEITIDNSGSMNEFCGNGSKIEHVKHTLKNILRVIVEKNMPISIQVNIFNDQYKEIIELRQVTSENLEELVQNIVSIRADGGTDIGLATTESQKVLHKYNGTFNKIYHLFLTDGNASSGECDNDRLIDQISGDYPTAFIGYGLDHNAYLLLAFSKKNPESSYQLVDNYETIGNLCGELLYNICYPSVKDVSICTPAEADLIYNARTNTWSNIVDAGTFISGKTYRFPIYTTDECATIVNTSGTTNDDIDIDTDVFINDTDPTTDLTKEIFRYATDRLLFLSMNGEKGNKKKVRQLFKSIRSFAREHDILNDTFYKLMFDDLYTCYTGNDISLQARIISNTRNQTFRSQSNQAAEYSQASHITRSNAIDLEPVGLSRSVSCTYNEFEGEENEGEEIEGEENEGEENEETDIDDITLFVSENTQNDLNATQEMYGVMRSVSSR